MRRVALGLVTALVLAACAPAFVPADGPAPGVTVSCAPEGEYTVCRVDADPALDRLFLVFEGDGLVANAPECQPGPGDLACAVGAIDSFYVVAISGDLDLRPGALIGVACRAECHPLYLE